MGVGWPSGENLIHPLRADDARTLCISISIMHHDNYSLIWVNRREKYVTRCPCYELQPNLCPKADEVSDDEALP